MEKFITSHKSRVKRANEYRATSPERISIIDREALVEFYLLEDVLRLLEWRLGESIRDYKDVTEQNEPFGKQATQSNIATFTAMIDIFKATINVSRAQIRCGNYKAVWRAIPEHVLMTAANQVGNLKILKDIVIGMIKTLMEEALEAQGIKMTLDEYLRSAQSHDANVRAVKGLPSPEELKKLIDNLVQSFE